MMSDNDQAEQCKPAGSDIEEYKLTIEYYKIIKDYCKHEDSLVNIRLTWMIGINAVLFPTFAAVVISIDKLPRSFDMNVFTWGIYALAAIGLVITLACSSGVYAAMTALKSLAKFWEHHKKSIALTPLWQGAVFPDVLGGGYDNRAEVQPKWKPNSFVSPHNLGLGYPLVIPFVFGTAWIAVIVCNIRNVFLGSH